MMIEMGERVMRKKIGVFLTDPAASARRRIKAALAKEKSIYIAGEASSKEEILEAIRNDCPDVIIIDGKSVQKHGSGLLREFKRLCPETRVVLLSQSDHPSDVLPALKTGIEGYVLNHLGREHLVEAIEGIMEGGAYFSPAVSRVLLDEYMQSSERLEQKSPVKLTTRERQVLTSIVNGKTNKETACDLGLGVRTIETHRERVMRKLHARNTAELTKIAVTTGVLNGGE